ncbi:MAG: aspartate aminotransferase family protein [Nitrospinota bacterium]|nr:MAG: aspartate aminotransferase family protein [Nitrospinota bacterium]
MQEQKNPLSMQTVDVKQEALEHVWMHATPMQEVAPEIGSRIIVEGKGCRVTDIEGRTYIDALAGLWLVNIGYGRREVAEAAARQMERIHYVSSAGYTTVPTTVLANKLAEITPGSLARTFFVSGGSEAVESAIKIAKQYHYLQGFPRRYKVISRRYSYHGATFGAMSVSAARYMKKSIFEPLMPGTMHVPPPYCYRCDYGMTYPSCELYCARAIEQTVRFEDPETVAAIIAEPISASCGIVVPPPEYLGMLRQICDRYGILLIADEVINGFGRTGKMFACEHWNLEPDIMTVAKGLTSGYVPMGAAIVKPEIADVFMGERKRAIQHLLTFGGHAAAAAAALENLAIIERENLVENSAQVGAYLLDQLRQLSDHPMVGDVRGLGLLCGVELVKDKKTREPFAEADELPKRMTEKLRDRGMICRVAGNVIPFSPPLVVTRSDVDEMVRIVKESIEEFAREAGIQ